MASAGEPYVSFSAGLGLMHSQDIKSGGVTYDDAIEWKSGLAVEGAVGTTVSDGRVEFAVGYQSHDMDNIMGITQINDLTISDIEVSVLSYMLNGYKDFKLDGEISPYLMGGLGMATITGEYLGASTDDTVFAYQVGAGVAMEAADNITVDLGYRYFGTAEASGLIDGWDISFATSKILLGMRYSF
ncbi:MAG: outer membrane beta-barrel protein [Chlorobium phaeovibrioides]|nr:outer membrane beta-barrel protein [Chlorobium phaeovibrioides]